MLSELGTTISNLQVTKVIDGDTISVDIDGNIESLRLICLDTEESRKGGSKPRTKAGLLAKTYAEEFFSNDDGSFVKIDLEFDTDDPIDVCLKKHRGNFGRLLCYVHKNSQNYNIEAVKHGFSPYFIKYGFSRIYHDSFVLSEINAQANKLIIWNPATNEDGKNRNYNELIPWWYLRSQMIQDYRSFVNSSNILSVRLDYEKIKEKATNKEEAIVFCDLQDGIQNRLSGSIIYAGSRIHQFNIWIPTSDDGTSEKIIELLLLRYTDRKNSEDDDVTKRQRRNYVFVSGTLEMYNDSRPQIVVTDIDQMSDVP